MTMGWLTVKKISIATFSKGEQKKVSIETYTSNKARIFHHDVTLISTFFDSI